jgi:hypothetical protein
MAAGNGIAPSLGGLGDLALHLGVDPDVVERAGDDRHGCVAELGAGRLGITEVVALHRRDDADHKPDHDKDRWRRRDPRWALLGRSLSLQDSSHNRGRGLKVVPAWASTINLLAFAPAGAGSVVAGRRPGLVVVGLHRLLGHAVEHLIWRERSERWLVLGEWPTRRD